MWNHLYVGNISKILMRADEKVVYEFVIRNKHLAESLLHAGLNKLKAQKTSSANNFHPVLCRA